MPVGQGMAGTGAIVRRATGHRIRASGQFIVRLRLIVRGIQVIVRLLIHGRQETPDRRGMGIRALVRLEMGMVILELGRLVMGTVILELGLLEMEMVILGLGRLEMGTVIRALVRRGMGTSRAFSRCGPAIQALGRHHSQSRRLVLRHNQSRRLGLLLRLGQTRVEAVSGRVADREAVSGLAAVRDPVAVEAVRSHARRVAVVKDAKGSSENDWGEV
jgi:hypothetical protein